MTTLKLKEDYKSKYEKLKEFVRGKWKGDCSECAAIANGVLNQEVQSSRDTIHLGDTNK